MTRTNERLVGPAARPRRGERGGARLKLLLVLAVIAAVGYAGSRYVPVAYNARVFKTFMQDTVDTASVSSKPPAWIEERLRKSFEDYGVPEDATVKISRNGTRVEATVQYTQTVALLVTDYDYEFNETVRSTNIMGSR